jgi:hypothetical protein
MCVFGICQSFQYYGLSCILSSNGDTLKGMRIIGIPRPILMMYCTIHLWNIFQSEIAKANDRITKLQETLEKNEKNEKSMLERLAKHEKVLNMK